jgi:hypothetical protein
MRKILLLGAVVFCTSSFIAQEQISNKMMISLEGTTTFDGEISGGGLKIDRKINSNFTIGIFSSVLARTYPEVYYQDGKYVATQDNGNQVNYEFKSDSIYGGDIYTEDWGPTILDLQIGLRLKYSLYTQKATKPYIAFNLAYNNQLSTDNTESIIINRLDENNGFLTSFELGLDQNISNRFTFFINVRATLITTLVHNHVDLKKLTQELTEEVTVVNGSGTTTYGGGYTKRATYVETLTEKRFPTFFGSAGFGYKIF